jgi:hypothetical protein
MRRGGDVDDQPIAEGLYQVPCAGGIRELSSAPGPPYWPARFARRGIRDPAAAVFGTAPLPRLHRTLVQKKSPRNRKTRKGHPENFS